MSKEVLRFQRNSEGTWDIVWKDTDNGMLYLGDDKNNLSPAQTLYSYGQATTRDYYRDGKPVTRL